MWDVFISHASEDKEVVARPLAEELKLRGFRVWYDNYTLKLGDSLRRSIDAGLRDSRFGVVVLSTNFFAKEWPQRELDGLTAREISGHKVILPIWHEVTHADVSRFSPVLADRIGVSTSKGTSAVVDEIEDVLRASAGLAVLGIDITPGEARSYRAAASKRARKIWRPLGHLSYPVLSDSEHSRGGFIYDIAKSLDTAFQGGGFRKFTTLLHVEKHEAAGQSVFT